MNITAHTSICGIIGNPVSHSLSPAMHNAAYQSCGLNFAYVAFPVSDVKLAVAGIRALHIRGVSVTIPHKITVMQYLDHVDTRAKKIGAVNTIVHTDGVLTGYNTDTLGAMRALEEKIQLSGKRAVVLGAGGVARAIISGLLDYECSVQIINRTVKRAQMLASEFGCEYADLTDISRTIKESDILINATSIGMDEHDTMRLVPETSLHKNLTVFDVVYRTGDTQLMKDAKKAMCITVSGRMMLLFQACAQFELFTGVPASIQVMKDVLFQRSEHGR